MPSLAFVVAGNNAGARGTDPQVRLDDDHELPSILAGLPYAVPSNALTGRALPYSYVSAALGAFVHVGTPSSPTRVSTPILHLIAPERFSMAFRRALGDGFPRGPYPSLTALVQAAIAFTRTLPLATLHSDYLLTPTDLITAQGLAGGTGTIHKALAQGFTYSMLADASTGWLTSSRAVTPLICVP